MSQISPLAELQFRLLTTEAFKDDFQSILRSLRVCFRFCFEFVDMLHFGNSIHEVFESAITGRYVYECSMSCNICLG